MQVQAFFQEAFIRVPQTTRRWHHCDSRRQQTHRVHGDAGKKSCFDLRDGRKFQVRYNEAAVSFPTVSIGEASQQGTWFVFGPGCQATLPGSSEEFLRTCVKDPDAAKLEKHMRSVLVAVFGDGTHGRSTVVPESQDSKVSC